MRVHTGLIKELELWSKHKRLPVLHHDCSATSSQQQACGLWKGCRWHGRREKDRERQDQRDRQAHSGRHYCSVWRDVSDGAVKDGQSDHERSRDEDEFEIKDINNFMMQNEISEK
jgi:hypothetical protein